MSGQEHFDEWMRQMLSTHRASLVAGVAHPPSVALQAVFSSAESAGHTAIESSDANPSRGAIMHAGLAALDRIYGTAGGDSL